MKNRVVTVVLALIVGLSCATASATPPDARAELEATKPEGITITTVQEVDRKVSIEGTAVSNAAIVNLLRGLEGSTAFSNPTLSAVKATERDGKKVFEFSMQVERRP